MRIHRLTVRDVKGVGERTVHFPDHGVVVIEGPNEVGKSTLLEALDRLLDTRCKASSRSAAVRAMQPVGRDAGPFAEAELTVGRYRVVFAKQWLRQTATTLRVLSPVPQQLTGDDAHHRMAAILDECLDRPLLDALRFAQAAELGQIPLADSAVLAEALDGAAGADLHTDGGADLLAAAEEEFLTYYTPTGRPTGPLRAAVTEMLAAQEEAVHAHQRLVEADELLAERDQAEVDADAAVADLPRLQAAVEEARELAEAAQAVAAHRDEAASAAEASRVALERATRDLEARRRQVREVHQRGRELHDVRERTDRDQAAVAPAREALSRAEERRAEAQADLSRAQDVLARAMLDRDHVIELTEVAALRSRLARVDRLTRDLDEARAQQDRHRVTPDLLRRITDSAHEAGAARAALESAATLWSVEALRPGQVVEVDGVVDELTPGDAVPDRHLSRETVIEVPGQLRLVVRPQADVTERARRCESAEAAVRDLLADAGVPDLAAARAAADERAEVTRTVAQVRADLSACLGGSTPAALSARLAALEEETTAYAAARGSTEGMPAEPDQARALQRAAQRAVREHHHLVDEAVRECEEAHRSLETVLRRAATGAARFDALADELARSQERLDDDRSRADDDVLDARVGQAHAAHEAGVDRLMRARAALEEADPAGAREGCRRATEMLAAARRRAGEARDRLNQLVGRVEMVAGEGRHEALDGALLAFEEARSSLLSVDRRARAARQLHLTLRRHRDAAHTAYVRPYAAQLQQLGRQVYGATFDVTVSSDLVITHRHLHGTTVPFDSLSGGAKEQLGILARLAVATLVDPEHGVPVVIDDALGYTDPDRLQRVGEVLAAPARTSQVILLTCTPSRYEGIPGATMISLTA